MGLRGESAASEEKYVLGLAVCQEIGHRHLEAATHLALGSLLAAEGDLDGALAAAQEAYRLDETNPYVMDTLGALYLRKGLEQRALSLLEEAHAAAPAMPFTPEGNSTSSPACTLSRP